MEHSAMVVATIYTDDADERFKFRSVYVNQNGCYTGLGLELLKNFREHDDALRIICKGRCI